jgi:c-di-GMP-binding flagellar brake protein YcgR
MASEAYKPAAGPPTLAPAVKAAEHPMSAPTAAVSGPAWEDLPLKALRLRAGLFLQTQRLVKDSPNYEAQFLGAIDGKCLFVVPIGTFSIKTGMRAGETFVIRGFTGVYDFQFEAKVIQAFDFTFREPAYAYAVLEFPASVKARRVRNSLRIRTSIPATASPRNGQAPSEVKILDLSVDGALLRSPVDLGWAGELITVAFSMGSDEDMVYVEAQARICHRREDGGEMLVGVLFETLSERDRLTLREFVVASVE